MKNELGETAYKLLDGMFPLDESTNKEDEPWIEVCEAICKEKSLEVIVRYDKEMRKVYEESNN